MPAAATVDIMEVLRVCLSEVPARLRARLIEVARENAGTVDDQIALASDIADLVRRAIKESRG